MNRTRQASAFLLTAAALAIPASASAQSAGKGADEWVWRAAINLWLPGIDATARYDLPIGGGSTAETDPSGYLSKIKFVFMGTLEAQRGDWSGFADVVYLDLGDLKTKVTSISGPGGSVVVPVDTGTHTDLKAFVGTFAGGYALMRDPGTRVEAIAGVRYTKLKPELSWEFSGPAGGLDRTGSIGKSKDFVDGVVGIRGHSQLGGNWDLRYYLDVGAGTSQLTWQALAGIGYRFNWGDASLSYRHLAYDLQNDRPISDITFSGPQFAVGFTF